MTQKTTVVAVLNQKGGAGKTTIATNVASWLHAEGQKTMLVDLDPQGSATDWSDTRDGDQDLCPVIRMGKGVARDLRKLANDNEWIIIDGAPQVSELAVAAIKSADIVIIPTQPSPYDIWACADLVDLIKDRQEIMEGRPIAAFLVSRAIKNTKLSGEILTALKGYELPIMRSITHQRVDYPDTAKVGDSIVDLPRDNKARLEIRAIANELKEMREQL